MLFTESLVSRQFLRIVHIRNCVFFRRVADRSTMLVLGTSRAVRLRLEAVVALFALSLVEDKYPGRGAARDYRLQPLQ